MLRPLLIAAVLVAPAWAKAPVPIPPRVLVAPYAGIITPVSAEFRGLTVLECPPNTHGVAILHALDELGELDPAMLGEDDPAAVLRTVQAMGRAMQYAKETVAIFLVVPPPDDFVILLVAVAADPG